MTMKFSAEPEKTRFDVYFAEDVVDVLTAVTAAAARLGLDSATVDKLLALVAERFRLEAEPVR